MNVILFHVKTTQISLRQLVQIESLLLKRRKASLALARAAAVAAVISVYFLCMRYGITLTSFSASGDVNLRSIKMASGVAPWP